ncbi:MAG: glutathione S-transferase family protein [Candidatus Omnitrophica bacterium]|nr:glutathione S-transferase family protein [Candidatus Omnitrophota bacterium]
MLKIYGSDLSSPANKIRFVANYLGIKYDYILVKLREGEHQKPEFLRINPIGKIPAIDDDGFCLFESNAICRYLADKQQSNIYPKSLKERAITDSWIDFGSMHVGVAVSKVVYNRIFAPIRKVEIDERSIKEGLEFLARFLPIVDRQLSANNYLMGNSITLADFNMLALLDPVEMAQIDITTYKNICVWRENLRKENFYTQCHHEYGESLKQNSR